MSLLAYIRSEWSAIVSFLFFAACFTAVATLLGGCVKPGTKTGPLRVVDYTAELAAHNAKDATILREADSIDAISPEAAPHTAAQRAAVAAAPAADLERIVSDLRAAVAAAKNQADADAKTIAALRQDITDLKNQALREQSRWLTWSGVALLGAFGVSLVFGHLAAAMKTWPLALLGAGCFGLAQLISHPWFLRGFIGLLVAGIAYSAYYVFDRHREGRLRRSLEKKADVLKQIVPVLDDAYDSAADSVKQALDANIFARLGNLFSNEQKATVHAVRAEAKSTP